MKGRLTYEQLNTAVENINTAVTGKYKILNQPAKTLNNATRKLHQRFKEEENKDTKGTSVKLLCSKEGSLLCCPLTHNKVGHCIE